MIGRSVVILAALVLAPQAAAQSIHLDLKATLETESGGVVLEESLQVVGEAVANFRLPSAMSLKSMKIDGPGSRLRRKDGVWTLDFEGDNEHRMKLVFGGNFTDAGDQAAMVGPEGSYFPGHGGWYPNFGSELFTVSIDIDVPESQRALANGRLVSEVVKDGRYLARFVTDRPVDEITLIAGPYVIDERLLGEIRLRSYFHADIADLSTAYLDSSAGYIDRYSSLIGDYPYSAFSVVSSPLPVGLGYPGIAYMGSQVLRLPFIRDISLGHEVLHNWWGNGVFIDFAGGNWAEGLTTFMADYAYAEDKGEDAARAMRRRWLTDYAALPVEQDVAVSSFTGRRHGASLITGYNKAAMLFVMLRDEIGIQAFDDGIRKFWADQQFTRATWVDLRSAFEVAAGRKLKRFFGQWLDQPGAPKLSVKSVKTTIAGDGYRISFTLIQEAPAYSLSVPVVVETAAGPQQFRVALDDRIERYTLDLDAAPLALEIDPDTRLFRRLDPSETPLVLRHVMLAPRLVVTVASDDLAMVSAAKSLAKRMVEGDLDYIGPSSDVPQGTALMIVGSGLALDRRLKAADLPAMPQAVDARGQVRLWTTRSIDGFPVVIIDADSAEALKSVSTKLRHYGAKSFLVFDQGKLADDGVWPPGAKPLRIEFPNTL